MQRSQLKLLMAVSLVLTGAAVVGTQTAWADTIPIATFGFTELDGNYDGAAGFSTDVASDTTGDVTRKVPGNGTALYHVDFSGGPATYAMSMNLSGITPNSAVGNGTFMVRDIDGDRIVGNIAGLWTRVNIFGYFNGLLSDIYFDSSGGDGLFEGPSGGSFSMDFTGYGQAPYEGAIVNLLTGSWFTPGNAWADQSTLVTASIVPEPCTSLVGVMGLLALSVVRRR